LMRGMTPRSSIIDKPLRFLDKPIPLCPVNESVPPRNTGLVTANCCGKHFAVHRFNSHLRPVWYQMLSSAFEKENYDRPRKTEYRDSSTQTYYANCAIATRTCSKSSFIVRVCRCSSLLLDDRHRRSESNRNAHECWQRRSIYRRFESDPSAPYTIVVRQQPIS